MGRKFHDLFTIFLASLPIIVITQSRTSDPILRIGVITGAGLIIILNIITILFRLLDPTGEDITRKIDIIAMLGAYIMIVAYLLGFILVPELTVLDMSIDWGFIPFGFYFVFSFILMMILSSTMMKVKYSVSMVLAIPVLIFTQSSKLIISLWDIHFPPKLRELVPYLDVTRTFILSFTQILADPKRLETEQALDALGDMSEQVDEIAEGYAIRKGIGQSIDTGLTIVVFAFFGVLAILTDDLGIPPTVVALLFGSLALAFSTFAGLFGPFYGLAGAAKDFSLKYGNYRAASFYRAGEQLFAIPFMAASAGFLFLDLPPIDAETLDEFKHDMQEQLHEITDSVSSLLGRDKAAVPRKTQKMIGELMATTEASMAKLDFRNIREETARQFALTYFHHEFSLRPWARKRAVKEFAKKNYFDVQTGEETLQLISFKIGQGQESDDLVNNVMIASAMKGVIMMENKYQEMLEDVELGQTCTGLAFGARQFLNDHYRVRTRRQKFFSGLKNFFFGLIAIPAVLIMAYHSYANRFYNKLSEEIMNGIFFGRAIELTKLRYREIYDQLKLLPDKISKSIANFRSRSEKEKTEQREQRNWQLLRRIKRVFGMIWEVFIFPVMLVINIIKWIYRRIVQDKADPREKFEEAVAHAALVSMYDELYKRLVMQTHVSTAY